MKKIKVLVLNKKERLFVPNRTIDKILETLKTIENIEDFWILSESGQSIDTLKNLPHRHIKYKFFEDYNTDNVIEILKIVKPDVILSSNDYDFWSRSFLVAAKFLNIPTVLLMQFLFDYAKEKNDNIIKGRLFHLKGRIRFLVGKYLLLLKTYRNVRLDILSIIKNIVDDVLVTFTQFEPSGKYGCELILVNNDTLLQSIKKQNNISKIVITGDPQLDDLIKKFNHNINGNKKTSKSKITVVFLTTSLVEHGLWSKKMWEETIRRTCVVFQNHFSEKVNLVFKIHPASEKKDEYEKLFSKYGFNFQIFQSEDLDEIISNSDLILAFGDTWSLWDALIMNKPIIMINFVNYPTTMIPFLQAGVVYEVKQENDLIEIMSNIKNLITDKSKKDTFLKNYLYKLDGKSSERSAIAILELIKNSQTK